jgi:hypothetical protein
MPTLPDTNALATLPLVALTVAALTAHGNHGQTISMPQWLTRFSVAPVAALPSPQKAFKNYPA